MNPFLKQSWCKHKYPRGNNNGCFIASLIVIVLGIIAVVKALFGRSDLWRPALRPRFYLSQRRGVLLRRTRVQRATKDIE